MKILLAILFCASLAFAHEGHDHDKPAQIKAPKGGLIKTLEETHVEVLEDNGQVYVYLYDKTLKPKSVKGFKLTAKTKLPRADKEQSLELKAQEKSYKANFKSKAHRYTLILTIFDPATGHTDTLNYIIEPKR